MAILNQLYTRLLDACGTLAGLLIAAVAVLVSFDVVIRNFELGNLPWVIEIAEYILFVSTFLAAPWVLRQGAHVRVDLLLVSLPKPITRRLETVVDVAGLAISLTLLYYGLTATVDAYRIGAMIFKELIIAEWWLLAVIPFSTGLLAVEFALRALGFRGTAEALIEFPKDGF